MKITDTQTSSKIVSLPGKRNADSPSENTQPANRSDRVTLSPRARELLKAQQSLAMIPDVRADKVDAVKARIADGSYRVDSDKIAAKMIREALSDDD